jgi:2,3-bisphosphoglycerate-dependent phosphoglycerate mutase
MPATKRVWLIRHGQTDYNVQHRWQGHMDVPLNTNGQGEVQTLADHLQGAPFTVIYTSDLTRTVDTAAPLAAKLGLTPIPDTRLREIKLGVFEGRTSAEIKATHPDQLARWRGPDLEFAIEGGESRMDVRRRALEALQDMTTDDSHTDIAVITHGGTIRLLLGGLFPDDPRFTAKLPVPNTSITRLESTTDGPWKLLELAVTPHFPASNIQTDTR